LYSPFFCFLQQENSETGFAFPSVLYGYLIKSQKRLQHDFLICGKLNKQILRISFVHLVNFALNPRQFPFILPVYTG